MNQQSEEHKINDKDNLNVKDDKESKKDIEQTQNSELSIANFVAKNGEMEELKKKRDAFCGPFKWVGLVIFIYLLLSPLLNIITKAGPNSWVLVFLLIPIGLIIWSYVEYWSRAECWYLCICRGIILDLQKTDSALKWLCTLPMFFVYMFLLVMVILYAVGLTGDNPNESVDFAGVRAAIAAANVTTVDQIYETLSRFNGSDPTCSGGTTSPIPLEGVPAKVVDAIFYLLGYLFVLLLTKSVVDLEGGHRILTVNLFISYLKDVKVLEARGYKVVHFTQVQNYIKNKRKNDPFSWNEIFQLSHEPDSKAPKVDLTWGCSLAPILREHRDHDQ